MARVTLNTWNIFKYGYLALVIAGIIIILSPAFRPKLYKPKPHSPDIFDLVSYF